MTKTRGTYKGILVFGEKHISSSFGKQIQEYKSYLWRVKGVVLVGMGARAHKMGQQPSLLYTFLTSLLKPCAHTASKIKEL